MANTLIGAHCDRREEGSHDGGPHHLSVPTPILSLPEATHPQLIQTDVRVGGLELILPNLGSQKSPRITGQEAGLAVPSQKH